MWVATTFPGPPQPKYRRPKSSRPHRPSWLPAPCTRAAALPTSEQRSTGTKEKYNTDLCYTEEPEEITAEVGPAVQIAERTRPAYSLKAAFAESGNETTGKACF